MGTKNFIIIAKRGECSFVQKANYAQMIGAKMLVIVDNVNEDISNIIMYFYYLGMKILNLLIKFLFLQ